MPHSTLTSTSYGSLSDMSFNLINATHNRDSLKQTSQGTQQSGNAANANLDANTIHKRDKPATTQPYPTITNLKPMKHDECVVAEWKLFNRKTFMGNIVSITSGLGYVASVGLTVAVLSPTGDIIAVFGHGTVKYLKRKVLFCK